MSLSLEVLISAHRMIVFMILLKVASFKFSDTCVFARKLLSFSKPTLESRLTEIPV